MKSIVEKVEDSSMPGQVTLVVTHYADDWKPGDLSLGQSMVPFNADDTTAVIDARITALQTVVSDSHTARLQAEALIKHAVVNAGLPVLQTDAAVL